MGFKQYWVKAAPCTAVTTFWPKNAVSMTVNIRRICTFCGHPNVPYIQGQTGTSIVARSTRLLPRSLDRGGHEGGGSQSCDSLCISSGLRAEYSSVCLV